VLALLLAVIIGLDVAAKRTDRNRRRAYSRVRW